MVANFIGGLFRLASPLFPDRQKRLIFLGSFTTNVANKEVLDDETLASLNKLMNVGLREDAIKLSSSLNRVIWNGRNTGDIAERIRQFNVTDEEAPGKLNQLITQIHNCIPKWLMYEKVDEDIRTLITHRRDVLGGK